MMTENPKAPLIVADWNEAFDVCRERNRPVRVMDRSGQVDRIFPSGSVQPCISGAKCDIIILPDD